MASKRISEFHEKSAEKDASDTNVNQRSVAEPKAEYSTSYEFNTSCPAVLEPSQNDPLFRREALRGPNKTYDALMRSYTSTEVYANSDDLLTEEEPGHHWYRNRCNSSYANLFYQYKNFAIKFRASRFIYILQILLFLLPFSAIAMGIKYNKSCPGSPSLTAITVLTGIFGVLLIGQWMIIKFCHRDDRPCDGQQKFGILLFFLLVSALLELEIYLFVKMSPSYNPSTSNYCSKTFYDYTYYKFIAAFGSMLLVVLLYFPNYRSYVSSVVCSDPLTASCYKGASVRNE